MPVNHASFNLEAGDPTGNGRHVMVRTGSEHCKTYAPPTAVFARNELQEADMESFCPHRGSNFSVNTT